MNPRGASLFQEIHQAAKSNHGAARMVIKSPVSAARCASNLAIVPWPVPSTNIDARW